MAVRKNKTPDFFNEETFDPVEVATKQGGRGKPGSGLSPKTHVGHAVNKKKAGFYLSVELLDRFSHKFYELKLAGAAIENKSALLELALSFALDDLDRGSKSQVMQNIES
jgi:hypothetical protein